MSKEIEVFYRSKPTEDYSIRRKYSPEMPTETKGRREFVWEHDYWQKLVWNEQGFDRTFPAVPCLYQVCWIADNPPTGHIIVAATHPGSFLIKRNLEDGEVLYLGKTHNLSKRIAWQFSRRHGSNGLARKLRELIYGDLSPQRISQQISDLELKCVRDSVKIRYAVVEDWLARDFLKSYGKCMLKPLLNIEAER